MIEFIAPSPSKIVSAYLTTRNGHSTKGFSEQSNTVLSQSHRRESNDVVFFNDDLNCDTPDDTGVRGDQIVAVQFDPIAIPHGSTVLRAYITMENADCAGDTCKSDTVCSADVKGRIWLERNRNPLYFARTDGDITNRLPDDKGIHVLWDIPHVPAVNESEFGVLVKTPDLSKLVQDLVDNCEWSATENHLTFIFTHDSGEGQRRYFPSRNYHPYG
jgi:hypothetical protein